MNRFAPTQATGMPKWPMIAGTFAGPGQPGVLLQTGLELSSVVTRLPWNRGCAGQRDQPNQHQGMAPWDTRHRPLRGATQERPTEGPKKKGHPAPIHAALRNSTAQYATFKHIYGHVRAGSSTAFCGSFLSALKAVA